MQPSRDSDSSPETVAEDRRSWRRYNTTPQTVALHTAGGNLVATLLDESIGGIAILLPSGCDLQIGQTLNVSRYGAPALGLLRGIQDLDGQGCRVSISWCRDTKQHDAIGRRNKEIAHFVSHDRMQLVCRLLGNEQLSKTTVELWDGAQFDIPNDQLCSRGRDVRRAELTEAISELPVLARLYGLQPVMTHDGLVEQIMEFEFSF